MARILQILVNAAALWVAVTIVPDLDWSGTEWWKFLLVAVDLQPGEHLHQADPEDHHPADHVPHARALPAGHQRPDAAADRRVSGRPDLGFHVDGFGAALLGSIVISIVGWALSMIVGAITPGVD